MYGPIKKKLYRLIRYKPNFCPDCNGPVFRNGGCVYCPSCGWSLCSMSHRNQVPKPHKKHLNLKGVIS